MLIVAALGGHALLRSGDPMTAAEQRANVRLAAQALAPLAGRHQFVIEHRNQSLAGTDVPVAHVLEQELGNLLPFERPLATLLTTVVAPPEPQRLYELRAIQWLLEHDTIVIASGAAPCDPAEVRLPPAACVVEADLACALLARDLGADLLLLLTDADAVYAGWRTSSQKAIRRASPAALAAMPFAPFSMKPKVDAACWFATSTGNIAAIGALADLDRIVAGEAGTTVSNMETGILCAA